MPEDPLNKRASFWMGGRVTANRIEQKHLDQTVLSAPVDGAPAGVDQILDDEEWGAAVLDGLATIVGWS